MTIDNSINGIIYGLSDSREPEVIRYIGLTTKSKETRLRNHKWDSGRNLRTNWIKSILRQNAELVLTEIDSGRMEDLPMMEQHYIRLFRSFGAPLVNGNFGGIGCYGYRWTEEQKNKMRGRDRSGKRGKTYEEAYGSRAADIKRKIGLKSIERNSISVIKKTDRRVWTDADRKEWSLMRVGVYHDKKQVVVQYRDNIEIAKFPSTLAASRTTGVSNSQIKKCCAGNTWRYSNGVRKRRSVETVSGFVFKKIAI